MKTIHREKKEIINLIGKRKLYNPILCKPTPFSEKESKSSEAPPDRIVGIKLLNCSIGVRAVMNGNNIPTPQEMG